MLLAMPGAAAIAIARLRHAAAMPPDDAAAASFFDYARRNARANILRVQRHYFAAMSCRR